MLPRKMWIKGGKTSDTNCLVSFFTAQKPAILTGVFDNALIVAKEVEECGNKYTPTHW